MKRKTSKDISVLEGELDIVSSSLSGFGRKITKKGGCVLKAHRGAVPYKFSRFSLWIYQLGLYGEL